MDYKLLACGALLLLLAGCSDAPVATQATKVVNGVKIDVASDPADPHVGDNNLEVTLSDAATNEPIVDANVTGTVTMTSPQLPGSSSSGRAKGNGLYEIPVSYPTATTYDITIEVDRPGKPAADLDITVDAAQ